MHGVNNVMELCIISFFYEFTTGHINQSLFYSSYTFNIPTKCTYVYTIEHMYYQHSSTCFGTYCAIFRENSLTYSKLFLLLLVYYRYNHYMKNTQNGKPR